MRETERENENKKDQFSATNQNLMFLAVMDYSLLKTGKELLSERTAVLRNVHGVEIISLVIG
jgi:hypothetical protein